MIKNGINEQLHYWYNVGKIMQETMSWHVRQH